MDICLCIRVCGHLSVCVCVDICLCIRVCGHLSVCVCVDIDLSCMYVRLCMCPSVCCVFMRVRGHVCRERVDMYVQVCVITILKC